MIISIKRFILQHDFEVETLINTRYILKIENTQPHEGKPTTRILMDSLDSSRGPDIIYTYDTLGTIKGKVTKARKVQGD